VARLSREQEGVAALGYVLENRVIGQQLYAAITTAPTDAGDNASGQYRGHATIRLFCPAVVNALQQDENRVTLDLRVNGQAQTITARLLVAADGNQSQVARMLAIGSSRQAYDQIALVTNVTPGRKHEQVAYERFTDSGPLAFLPMQHNRCSVVWSLRPQQAEYLYALDDADFLAQLQQRFGYRLGRLKKTGMRHIYPLFLQSASEMVHGRVALIGNAAHSVHPVAGQGFNLGLRDIALLAELIVAARQRTDDIGEPAMLAQYGRLRERDIQRVYYFTDTLVKTFSNAIAPLAQLRSLSLLLVDIMPDIKHQLARQSMGLSGPLTRLNRGLHL
jgi:2-octaprenyl-6-methoxyphenol hydroxylase